jgi:hypothetical protein
MTGKLEGKTDTRARRARTLAAMGLVSAERLVVLSGALMVVTALTELAGDNIPHLA